MGFKKGDRVIAAKGLGGWVFSDVDAGERGRIVRVNDGFFSTTYNVQFGDRVIEDVAENDLAEDADSGWW